MHSANLTASKGKLLTILQRPLLFENMFLNITLSGGIFKPQKTEQIFGGHLLGAKCFVYIVSFCSPTLCQSVYFNTPNSNEEAGATWHTNGGAGTRFWNSLQKAYSTIVPRFYHQTLQSPNFFTVTTVTSYCQPGLSRDNQAQKLLLWLLPLIFLKPPKNWLWFLEIFAMVAYPWQATALGWYHTLTWGWQSSCLPCSDHHAFSLSLSGKCFNDVTLCPPLCLFFPLLMSCPLGV